MTDTDRLFSKFLSYISAVFVFWPNYCITWVLVCEKNIYDNSAK